MKKGLDTKTALTDVITILASYFIMMFIVAFLYMNPVAKTKEIDSVDRFMIKLEWDINNKSDYDLWVQDPSGAKVGYSNKNGRATYLDRDDLGHANDILVIDGVKYTFEMNRETTFIRQALEGKYFVSVHLFARNGEPPATVTVTLIDIRNGARILMEKKLTNFENREEKFAFSFNINERKFVDDIDTETPFKILRNAKNGDGQ